MKTTFNWCGLNDSKMRKAEAIRLTTQLGWVYIFGWLPGKRHLISNNGSEYYYTLEELRGFVKLQINSSADVVLSIGTGKVVNYE